MNITFKQFLSENKKKTKLKTDSPPADDLFARYGLDGDGGIRKDKSLGSVNKPKDKDREDRDTPRLSTASDRTTRERLKGVKIDPSNIPDADFSKVDISGEEDLDQDNHTPNVAGVGERPKPTTPENLPAIISTAMTVSGKNVARVNVEWHMVKNLPGYIQKPIRAIGRQVFGEFTKTPLDKIQVIASLGGGPNSDVEVNSVAKFVTTRGKKRKDLEISFNEVFKDYGAEAKIYDCEGYTFFVMRDFAGNYIYSWPSKDTKTDRPTLDRPSFPALPGRR